MSNSDYFRNYREGKIYLSKAFTWHQNDKEAKRNISIVISNEDQVALGEVEGAFCLRLTGEKRKTGVVATITQDGNAIRRLQIQTFKDFGGEAIIGQKDEVFTFRPGEFRRLVEFVEELQFLDLSNTSKHSIVDRSSGTGSKIIIDDKHQVLIDHVETLNAIERLEFLHSLETSLSQDEVNIILGRRDALDAFENAMRQNDWREKNWQDFFEKEDWVFGYGLDYRISRVFDREMEIGSGGTDGKNRPIVDFLSTFTNYSVLVEIKTPSTPIFKKGKRTRAGVLEFSTEFISAVSQVFEQKAE